LLTEPRLPETLLTEPWLAGTLLTEPWLAGTRLPETALSSALLAGALLAKTRLAGRRAGQFPGGGLAARRGGGTPGGGLLHGQDRHDRAAARLGVQLRLPAEDLVPPDHGPDNQHHRSQRGQTYRQIDQPQTTGVDPPDKQPHRSQDHCENDAKPHHKRAPQCQAERTERPE
jgi:hypothetical protein